MIRVKVSTMRFIALLFRLTIILAQFSEASEFGTFNDYNNNLWRKIEENCEEKIPVDIKLKDEQSVARHTIYIRFELVTNVESKNIYQCQRFSETFLHKATLIDHVYRDQMNLEPEKFFYCKDQCKDYLPNDSMDGSIQIKHIADFCHLSLILVIPHEDFKKMTKEEMLERKVDYQTELLSLKEINESTEEQEVHHLEAYLRLFDDHEQRGDIKSICHHLYIKIDELHFSKHSIDYHSDNDDNDDNDKKNSLIVIVSCSVGGFVLLLVIGVAVYCARKRICCRDDMDKGNIVKRFYI